MYRHHIRESALKGDSWREVPCRTRDSNSQQYCALAFQLDALPTELFPPWLPELQTCIFSRKNQGNTGFSQSTLVIMVSFGISAEYDQKCHMEGSCQQVMCKLQSTIIYHTEVYFMIYMYLSANMWIVPLTDSLSSVLRICVADELRTAFPELFKGFAVTDLRIGSEFWRKKQKQ